MHFISSGFLSHSQGPNQDSLVRNVYIGVWVVGQELFQTLGVDHDYEKFHIVKDLGSSTCEEANQEQGEKTTTNHSVAVSNGC